MIKLIKVITSRLLTIGVLSYWYIAFFATGLLGQQKALGTPVSSFILSLPFLPFLPFVFLLNPDTTIIGLLILVFIVILFIMLHVKYGIKNLFIKLASIKGPCFSINILLISLLFGSLSIGFRVSGGAIISQRLVFGLFNPADLMVNIFSKIPGFFPLYNGSLAIGLFKDVILTGLAIASIYVVLITGKIVALKLLTFIYDNYLKTYFEKVR